MLRPFILVVVGVDTVPVDGGQAGAHQGMDLRHQIGPFPDKLLDRVHLARLDVDEEIIGSVGGQSIAPVCQEVGTDQHQQGQDHHAEADGQYLCRAEGVPADDIHQAETAGNADSCPQPVQAANGQPRRRNAVKAVSASPQKP